MEILINQLLEDFYPSFADKNLEYELSTIEDSIIIDAETNISYLSIFLMISFYSPYFCHPSMT